MKYTLVVGKQTCKNSIYSSIHLLQNKSVIYSITDYHKFTQFMYGN
jgi:hypothetical protein